jgi:hypothetical protein
MTPALSCRRGTGCRSTPGTSIASSRSGRRRRACPWCLCTRPAARARRCWSSWTCTHGWRCRSSATVRSGNDGHLLPGGLGVDAGSVDRAGQPARLRAKLSHAASVCCCRCDPGGLCQGTKPALTRVEPTGLEPVTPCLQRPPRCFAERRVSAWRTRCPGCRCHPAPGTLLQFAAAHNRPWLQGAAQPSLQPLSRPTWRNCTCWTPGVAPPSHR